MDIHELAKEAGRRGYTKKDLAAFIGVDPATLSRWLKPGREELPLLTRNALSYVEQTILSVAERPAPPERKRKKKEVA
jgi:transcriptional regulator with XRE-family HTH domain